MTDASRNDGSICAPAPSHIAMVLTSSARSAGRTLAELHERGAQLLQRQAHVLRARVRAQAALVAQPPTVERDQPPQPRRTGQVAEPVTGGHAPDLAEPAAAGGTGHGINLERTTHVRSGAAPARSRGPVKTRGAGGWGTYGSAPRRWRGSSGRRRRSCRREQAGGRGVAAPVAGPGAGRVTRRGRPGGRRASSAQPRSASAFDSAQM